MYTKFIEVHDVDVVDTEQDYIKLSLNVENICGFNRYAEDPEKAVIGMTDGCFHVTAESYDDVKKLIQDAGCIIAKADPRLDTSKPLTVADLKRMIGEPVWNSYLRCWHLVRECIGEQIILTYNSGNSCTYTDDDLLKFPLYRMRREA